MQIIYESERTARDGKELFIFSNQVTTMRSEFPPKKNRKQVLNGKLEFPAYINLLELKYQLIN